MCSAQAEFLSKYYQTHGNGKKKKSLQPISHFMVYRAKLYLRDPRSWPIPSLEFFEAFLHGDNLKTSKSVTLGDCHDLLPINALTNAEKSLHHCAKLTTAIVYL